jgi:hypothetical protein
MTQVQQRVLEKAEQLNPAPVPYIFEFVEPDVVLVACADMAKYEPAVILSWILGVVHALRLAYTDLAALAAETPPEWMYLIVERCPGNPGLCAAPNAHPVQTLVTILF